MSVPPAESPYVVEHDEVHHRFQVRLDGALAFVHYKYADGAIVFTHTEVPKEFEGRGIASLLARAGLDFAREHSLPVVPRCPYVAGYIKKHPEYQGLVKK